ncbi:MAG: AMP-binding protein, partial [Alphaproteobacteria bacterium]
MSQSYDDLHRRSLEDPEGFWGEAAAAIDWFKPWDRVLGAEGEFPRRWFEGAETNTCHNALDRHVAAGRGDDPALFYDSPVTGKKLTFTFGDLLDLTARFAGVLKGLGVEKGDRVIIYMPMIPEAVVAMLGCARIGAIHSVVFGGFAAHELAVRIDDCKAKVIVAGSCGVEPNRIVEYKPLLDGAIDQATHKPDHCVIVQREQAPASMVEGRDVDWAAAIAEAEPG